LATSIIIN